MSTSPAPAAARLQAQRILTIATASMLLVLAVVAVVALGLEDYPSPMVAGGLFALNVMTFLVAEFIGYRTVAIAPGTEPAAAADRALAAMQQTMTTRFALTEAPAIIALAGAFVTGTAWTYIVGAFWALPSMLWHMWPSRRIAAKLEQSLDREGGRSHLTDVVAGRGPALS